MHAAVSQRTKVLFYNGEIAKAKAQAEEREKKGKKEKKKKKKGHQLRIDD